MLTFISKYRNVSIITVAILATGIAAAAPPSSGDETYGNTIETDVKSKMSEWSDDAKAAWIQGKLETVLMLNEHLSAFEINTEINGTTAALNGTVDSNVKKELAQAIAMSIDGIEDVQNNLEVQQNYKPRKNELSESSKGNLKTLISDATITASVKTSLIASEVKARYINVDTKNGKVTLTGNVGDSATQDLAEQITKNTDGVVSVENKLIVKDKVAIL
jgi:osmotically-inducible protein OsmY